MINKFKKSVSLAIFVTAIHIPQVSADVFRDISLIGYHHLQGRQALQVTTKSDPANGDWVYIGHVPNSRTQEATLNPISGKA
jgi:hypothetical protein